MHYAIVREGGRFQVWKAETKEALVQEAASRRRAVSTFPKSEEIALAKAKNLNESAVKMGQSGASNEPPEVLTF